ncbi:MAG: hypothetical protein GTO02_01725, partial [Candidatus Dadabacteria bacterium]|nr:hypothetical protein [Candidatus Dadabacteria bacterium]
MTEVIEEKPLENMSFEEISDHMDKIENVESEEVKEVENTEEPVVEEQQESEEKVEPVQEAEQEVVQYDDEVDNPYFKGKSKKELVEII